MSNIAFIDLEASGLGARSWPIEVGWCFPDGAPEAYLIKPIADWSDDAWDPKAEALHGISRSVLDDGDSPERVCAALNEALAGRLVYSDAPDWDGFWLYRLFQAARVRRAFDLFDFHDLFAALSPAGFRALSTKAAAAAPHCHRVREDVLNMKTLYALAAAQVD